MNVVELNAWMLKERFSEKGQLWESLTVEQQEELIKADIESPDERELLSNSEMRKKHNSLLNPEKENI